MHATDVPTRIVVDASLGLKWVVQETHSQEAFMLARGRELLTSALFWAEAGNALASRIRRGHLERKRGDDAFRELRALPMRVRALDANAVSAALSIANELSHPIYDCCYLALAVEERSLVVTADRRFGAAAAKLPKLAASVLLIDDITF